MERPVNHVQGDREEMVSKKPLSTYEEDVAARVIRPYPGIQDFDALMTATGGTYTVQKYEGKFGSTIHYEIDVKFVGNLSRHSTRFIGDDHLILYPTKACHQTFDSVLQAVQDIVIEKDNYDRERKDRDREYRDRDDRSKSNRRNYRQPPPDSKDDLISTMMAQFQKEL